MQIDYKHICESILPTVKEVGTYIKTQFLNREEIHFQLKGKNEVVSEVDSKAEQLIVAKAKELLPEATFLTEEGTIQPKKSSLQWIIDPLDGTTNFYYGLPIFAISIALIDHDEIKIGIVYDVMQDDIFYAWKHGGCYLNGNKSKCSIVANTDEVFIATGIPNSDFNDISGFLNSLNDVIDQTRGIRRLGSASLELAYVAAGRFDAFFETGLKPWDVAASICLIQESGGIVTDLDGGTNFLFGKSILAAGKFVHADLLAVINKHT